MVVNPVGFVPIYDGGAPKIISAVASVGVTGGQLVYLSGAANVVSSGADSFVGSSLVVAGVASGLFFNGVVLTPGNTASGTNNYVAIMTQGTVILTAGSDVIPGQAVEALGGDSVQRLGSFGVAGGATDGTAAGRRIGRAMTGATSGTANYAVIQIQG